MNFKAEQERFDVIKWYDSIVAGEDQCGCYAFCGYCNKTETEPCARAAYRFDGCVLYDEEPSLAEEICCACEETASAKRLTPIVTIRLRAKKE